MYKSSYKTIYAALVTTLTRTGVNVGGTAGYPRVEIHSFVENPPSDKGGSVRVLTCVVESMSTASAVAASQLNDDNLQLLGGFAYSGEQFKVVGLVPTQLQDLTETSDPQQIIYRVLQTIDIYVQQL
jgi:hypothetical protein